MQCEYFKCTVLSMMAALMTLKHADSDFDQSIWSMLGSLMISVLSVIYLNILSVHSVM